MNNNCCNGIHYETENTQAQNKPDYLSGCMVCGAELIYNKTEKEKKCHYCGNEFSANAECVNGHFVCDNCHKVNAIEIIKNECLLSAEKDVSLLMQKIRSHKIFPVHGPEHHSLVPAVILAALRNNGAKVTDTQIISAIKRGQTVPGGSCAFNGTCGAAVGTGIAMSILLGVDPYDGKKRQVAQKVTAEVLGEIASLEAPRCCQRDSWIAFKTFSKILKEKEMISFEVSKIECKQFENNFECIFSACPLYAK